MVAGTARVMRVRLVVCSKQMRPYPLLSDTIH